MAMYRQWQMKMQTMMNNPQNQLQRMVQQQQMMIANLKKQLGERDKHYHKTIQTTINFKDLEMQALREQIEKLDEEVEQLDKYKVENHHMRQELNGLRGDHQNNVFDNFLGKIMSKKNDGKAQQKWAGGKGKKPKDAEVPGPPGSEKVSEKDAKVNALLKAKA